MNVIQRGILALIKSGISRKPEVLPEGFVLDDAVQLICKHQVVGMAYEGAVLCGISKQSAAMQKLFQIYYQQIIFSENQMNAVNKLLAAFEENGIDYIPVKGIELKQLYPDQAMRLMTDADVLIRMEQYDKITEIVRNLGYAEDGVSDHALVWAGDGLELELHRRLIPTTSPGYYRYFGEGWKCAQQVSGYRYQLPADYMYAFLLTHYVKHYRDSGIGLRQTIDLWLYMQKVPMDMLSLNQRLKDLDLLEFHDNLCQLLKSWFEDAPMNEKTEFISGYLFDCGVFGNRDNWLLGQSLRAGQQQGSIKKARVKMVKDAILAPMDVMQYRYPILNKAPWLLPVYWPVRWFEALFFRRYNIKKYSHNLKVASVEQIDSKQKSLLYVGLKLDV